MICHECKDEVVFGEACIVEPSDNPRHNWFFHVECHISWRIKCQQTDIDQKATAARLVN